MPRLVDFDPQWIDAPGRKGLGLTMKCTTGHCTGRLWVLFANPLDGEEPVADDCFSFMYDRLDPEQQEGPVYDRPCGKTRWQRTNDTFEILSLTPSVNAHQCGHFTITNGGW